MPAAKATQSRITRTLSACRANGITPGVVEVLEDGTIRVFDVACAPVIKSQQGEDSCDEIFGLGSD